jgi:5'-methylthioadenosine phosphorylase
MTRGLAVIARVGAHRPFLEKGARELEVQSLNTPFGISAPIHLLESGGIPFAVLSRHGEDRYATAAPFVNDLANIWALKEIGIEKILSWSAPGSLNPALAPGSLVVADDLLDETRSGPRTFFEGKGIGVIRQEAVFCPEIRALMIERLAGSPFPLHSRGVYVSVEGPRLETRAEIRKYRLFGGDLIGMNLAPEAFLAKELEMCYGAVCYPVNFAEGIKDRPYLRGVLFEGLANPEEMARVKEVEEAFPDLVLMLLAPVSASPRSCPCPVAMERYRIRGDIGEDFHTWIR